MGVFSDGGCYFLRGGLFSLCRRSRGMRRVRRNKSEIFGVPLQAQPDA